MFKILKYLIYTKMFEKMIETRIIRVKRIENQEKIMARRMIKAIVTTTIMTVIIIIVMIMRIKIGNRIKM